MDPDFFRRGVNTSGVHEHIQLAKIWQKDIVQGLFVPFARVGSGDPVRVLCLYTTNTLDEVEAFIAETLYNSSLPNLVCYSTCRLRPCDSTVDPTALLSG